MCISNGKTRGRSAYVYEDIALLEIYLVKKCWDEITKGSIMLKLIGSRLPKGLLIAMPIF